VIIERHLAPYVVYAEDSILRALQKITDNKSRVVFCVDERGILQGAFSDGDFRRWIATQTTVDLERRVLDAANRTPTSAPATATPAEIAGLFRPGVDIVPMLDERGHVVSFAVNQAEALRVGRHLVGPESPCLVIAEIGINHNGSVDLAKRLVDHAAEAGADVVKFQLRDLDALYRQGGGGASHGEDLGPQYTLDLLSRFSLGRDELFTVFDHARERDIDVMCTPWDAPSVDALVDYGVPALKIASADLTNHDLLRYAARLAAPRGIPLVLSTGMSREAEILETVALLREAGVGYALLHCQSTYPAPFKDVNLRYLQRLAKMGHCPVGYSGHERGYHVPVAAVALGAKIVEKHLTVDRAMEGNDHKVSLLPDELAAMVARIREVEEALGSPAPREVSTGELMNRVNLAKSLVATRRIEPGETVAAADVAVKSPGRGLQPNALPQLVGRTLRRGIDAGDFFYATDLTDAVAKGRQFAFRRPWGLPVRYHDWPALVTDATPDFLEFHFSYKDLDLDPRPFLEPACAELPASAGGRLPFALACHSPDLFAGDFLLNLASPDDAHWTRSIAELQRVVDTTVAMSEFFTAATDPTDPTRTLDPVVICSLGGFTHDRHLPLDALPRLYERVAAGLDRIDFTGVRFGAQTLPPFPWYMGGQLYCNLFVRAEDTAAFARDTGRQLVLDVSHSKLSATWEGRPFSEYAAALAPHAVHLHLVDAVGVDGEGVQVGEGDIDWPVLCEQLDRLCPTAGFIPEIWQGHVNNGEGFWLALERLEQWL